MTPNAFDIQGHRGARGLFPENTIPGFIAALDIGVRTLEMDVVISKDRQVVVSHDPWFARAICLRPDGRRIPRFARRRHRLYDMTYDEIGAYDAGTLLHPEFPRQQCLSSAKPLLSDVIDVSERHVEATGRAPVFYSIETKSRRKWENIYHPDPSTFTRLLFEVLRAGGVLERSVIQSFDVRTLQCVKRMMPPLRLSLLVRRERARRLDRNLSALGFVPSIYSPDYRAVDAALIEQAHGRGLSIVPWTVNDPEHMVRLRDMGVDGLITDYPDVAVRELGN